MRSYPSVTVIVPAYQAARTVGATISGILTQTYPGEVETILIDDGSTDATASVARAHGDDVIVVSQPNAGTAAARNAALACASGELVALCDADDILLPPYLETAIDAWQRAGSGRRFVTCNALLLTPGGVVHGRTVMHPPVPPPSRQRLAILEANVVSIFAVIPRDMLTELNGWATDCYLEDWELWIRAIHAGWEAVVQPVPHALYRWLPTSKSTQPDAVYAAEDQLLRGVLERDNGLRPHEREYLQRRLAGRSPRLLVHEAEAALRAGDYARARRLFGDAATLLPSNRQLAVKHRSLSVPGAAALWRRRLTRIDSGLARNTDVAR